VTEAAQALTDIALASPAIDRVEIRCDPANAASAAVAQRLGYQRTGAAGRLDIWSLVRVTESPARS
jgi:RimJ/RimL family protein N-acetyltransferase